MPQSQILNSLIVAHEHVVSAVYLSRTSDGHLLGLVVHVLKVGDRREC